MIKEFIEFDELCYLGESNFEPNYKILYFKLKNKTIHALRLIKHLI